MLSFGVSWSTLFRVHLLEYIFRGLFWSTHFGVQFWRLMEYTFLRVLDNKVDPNPLLFSGGHQTSL